MRQTRFGLSAIMLVALLPQLSAGEATVSEKFYNAIRSDKRPAVWRLLGTGANVNTRDSRGATPLMYAAAAGTPAMMQLLIAAGADVNARTSFDATALMWSAGDLAKVQLLLRNGADVNARSKRGRTPLLIAAMQGGNAQVVQFLLDKGADLTMDVNRAAIVAAAAANDTATVNLLLARGADPDVRGEAAFTALMMASANGNVETVRRLLAAGAQVNLRSADTYGPPVKHGPIAIGRLTALHLAAGSGNSELVRLLVDAGADINARDVRGMTPLMLAVATDHPSEQAVKTILAKGPEMGVKSNSGETAIEWAAKFRHSAIQPMLAERSQGENAPETRIQPVSYASINDTRAAMNDPRAAVEKSVALLQNTSRSFFKEGGCISCHAQNITTMAVSAARVKGIPYHEKEAAQTARATRLQFVAFADGMIERLDPPAVEILLYSLLALSYDGGRPDRVTDAVVHNIAAQQKADGSWGFIGIQRPPITDGRFSSTAIAIRVLRDFTPPARKAEMRRRIAQAARWLVQEESRTTEDAVMQLLGAKWAGLDEPVIQRFAQRLASLQREDGGWAQTQFLASDAYATGTALCALNEEAGWSPADAAYRKGVRYLLNTQAADGSWYVSSRAPQFQPYFESGFPYGHDQWISQMATGWATMALSAAVPQLKAAR